jgi:hypothetical protein
MIRLAHGLLAWMFALMVAGTALAQPVPKVVTLEPPKHVLLVGNSFYYYNRSIHNHLRDLVKEADAANEKSYTFRSLTVSGARLGDITGALEEQLKSRKWDVVIFQGHSTEPMVTNGERFEAFRAAARKSAQLIRDAGAKPGFFLTWAYQDKPEMLKPLAEGYVGTANELDAFVVPVGYAFERSLKARPGLTLHYTDKMHPSVAGTYLAACTFYATLYRKSPVGNAYTADLDKETATYLQGIAWETVKAYFAI